jgi:ADP-ribosyltransferase exoenzyme
VSFVEEPELVILKDFLEEASKPKEKVSPVKQQAQSMGLEYFGFGRYGRENHVTHLAHNGKLIPFHQPMKVSATKNWSGNQEIKVDQSGSRPSENLTPPNEVKHIDQTLRDFNHEEIKKFSDDEKNAIGNLFGGQLDRLNQALSQGKNAKNEEYAAMIKILDNLLLRMKIPIPLTAYRGTTDSGYQLSKRYFYSGYVTCAIDAAELTRQGKNVLALEMPKGAHGIYNDSGRKEIILPRQTTIRIVSKPIALEPPVEDKKGRPTDPILMWRAIIEK